MSLSDTPRRRTVVVKEVTTTLQFTEEISDFQTIRCESPRTVTRKRRTTTIVETFE